jgi:acyl carrier protein
VQIGVAQIEWKGLLRLMPSPVPARFAALAGDIAEEANSGESSRVHDILDAEAAALPGLLESYLRDHLARAMGTAPARIDAQQSLLSLGLDSLIALELRNRINSDFGFNVPLTRIMQSTSLSAFAAYIAEHLLPEQRNKEAKPAARGSAERTAEIATPGNGGASVVPDSAIDSAEPAEHDRDAPAITPLLDGQPKATPVPQRSAAHTPAE